VQLINRVDLELMMEKECSPHIEISPNPSKFDENIAIVIKGEFF